jgi:hypothetical protein
MIHLLGKNKLVRAIVCNVWGFFWAMAIIIEKKGDFAVIENALDQEEILERRARWEAKQRSK